MQPWTLFGKPEYNYSSKNLSEYLAAGFLSRTFQIRISKQVGAAVFVKYPFRISAELLAILTARVLSFCLSLQKNAEIDHFLPNSYLFTVPDHLAISFDDIL
jgi:hypothetical protein